MYKTVKLKAVIIHITLLTFSNSLYLWGIYHWWNNFVMEGLSILIYLFWRTIFRNSRFRGRRKNDINIDSLSIAKFRMLGAVGEYVHARMDACSTCCSKRSKKPDPCSPVKIPRVLAHPAVRRDGPGLSGSPRRFRRLQPPNHSSKPHYVKVKYYS